MVSFCPVSVVVDVDRAALCLAGLELLSFLSLPYGQDRRNIKVVKLFIMKA